jgi:hypothetical protein
MDDRRFDAMVRQLGESRSRRGVVRGVTIAAASALLVSVGWRPPEASARRNLCQLRCGGERRMCQQDCRDKGAATRECKRICKLVRDVCFERCEIWRREVAAKPVSRLTAGRGA